MPIGSLADVELTYLNIPSSVIFEPNALLELYFSKLRSSLERETLKAKHVSFNTNVMRR